jgi:hypothetical protein
MMKTPRIKKTALFPNREKVSEGERILKRGTSPRTRRPVIAGGKNPVIQREMVKKKIPMVLWAPELRSHNGGKIRDSKNTESPPIRINNLKILLTLNIKKLILSPFKTISKGY